MVFEIVISYSKMDVLLHEVLTSFCQLFSIVELTLTSKLKYFDYIISEFKTPFFLILKIIQVNNIHSVLRGHLLSANLALNNMAFSRG